MERMAFCNTQKQRPFCGDKSLQKTMMACGHWGGIPKGSLHSAVAALP